MSKIVWHAAENMNATKVLKQHAYKEAVCGKYWQEMYSGNVSLCGNGSICEDENKAVHISEIAAENLNEQKACKKCLRIFNNLPK